jgi:hypothetical protein
MLLATMAVNRTKCLRVKSRREITTTVADVLCIILSFSLLLLLIGGLSWLGFGVGFAIPPMGEDLNWVSMLQTNAGADVARTFWSIDHRNPLSPWWYIGARSLILHYSNGLLLLRYAMALFLAISCYIMVISLAGRGTRALALTTAMSVSVWMANRYFDQIFWNFQGALALSLLSVAAFACSQEPTHRARLFYALSLIGWFIALGTYTIQSGAILAMAYIAFRRADGHSHANRAVRLVRGLYQAALETLPHWLLFIMFLLIWQTTFNPGAAPAFQLQPDVGRFMQSMREGLWPSDLLLFAKILLASPYVVLYVVCALLCGLVCYVCLLGLNRNGTAKIESVTSSNVIDVLLVTLCLVAPTVIVEAGSAAWGPGARWPMVYQFSTPVIFLAVLSLASALVGPPWKARFWLAGVAAIFAAGIAFSLAHNRVQNDFARYEANVRQTLEAMAAEEMLLGRNVPTQALLLLPEGARWLSQDILSPTISKVWFPRRELEFRLMPRDRAPYEAFNSWWTIRFNEDREGVDNAKVWGGRVLYPDLRVIKFDNSGNGIRLASLTREELAGWSVEWNRTAPVQLSKKSEMTCPLNWSADQGYVGNGMDSAERDPNGRPFRWTIAPVARLVLPRPCQGPLTIRTTVISALSDRNLMGLTLRINGIQLQARRNRSSEFVMYEADVPPSADAGGQSFNLTLEVPRLDHLPGAGRGFGVAVHAIELVKTPTRGIAP